MATASLPLVEASDEDCPVCHEGFKKPKLLPCGHLLCRHCLLGWLRSHPQAACPLCRCAIADPGEPAPGTRWEELADGLPTDLVMAAIVESRQLLSEDHDCKGCGSQRASSLCLQCDDFLCCACVAVHNRLSVTRHHAVEELSSLTAEKLAASRPSLCPAHRDEVCKVWCGTHGLSMCVLCATTDHRQCPQLSQLGAKMQEARAVLAQLAAILTEGEGEVGAAIKRLEQSLQDSERRTQATLADIQTTRDRLNSALDGWERRLRDGALAAHSDVTAAVLDRKTRLLARRGALTSHKHVVERMREADTLDAVCEMTSPLERRVKGLDRSVTLPADAKVVSMTTLVIDPEAVSRIERELAALGQFKVDSAKETEKEPFAFRFHSNHGKHIVLSNNQHTAERKAPYHHGIVMCVEAMKVNMLYEVRVDETVSGCGYQVVYLGVVTQCPDSITLPADGWSGRMASAVVVDSNWVKVNGELGQNCTTSSVGEALCDVREGGRVGLALDDQHSLHLYIDRHSQGVVAPHLTQPCYFMVDLHAYWKKVTALPVRPVT